MLLLRLLGADRIGLALSVGVAVSAALMAIFLAHQQRRYRNSEPAARRGPRHHVVGRRALGKVGNALARYDRARRLLHDVLA